MTVTTHRAQARRLAMPVAAVVLGTALCFGDVGSAATLAASASASPSASRKPSATPHAKARHRAPDGVALRRIVAPATPVAPGDLVDADPLSFSDEYERAELVERMLAECRGIAYNAYELSRTSGESLWLPAPIQLFVVRVHHPYCADLLRTYAPKQSV